MTAARPGRARLEVDLGALGENWRRLAALARPAATGAVVKANGYGLGAVRVAGALRGVGCRHFFVASLDEAAELRHGGIQEPIFVFDGLGIARAPAMAAAGAIPVLNDPGEVERWSIEARRLGRRLPCALHVDTGLTRLGMTPAAASGLAEGWPDELELRLVMSHLACAEEPEQGLNELQRRRLQQIAACFAGTAASLAASSGIFLGEAYHFQLCRPGVALYGVNPTPGRANPMAPVVRLAASILQVHEVDVAGSVGYGATFRTRPGNRIATIALGYADGFPRAARGATARVAGHEVPFAGRVSMDLISLDVTGCPPDAARPGADVELVWGADGVDRLAAAAGTIGYEVLTRIGSRVERVYRGGAEG